jgi:tetratricopeptide (TPR) repeat protein
MFWAAAGIGLAVLLICTCLLLVKDPLSILKAYEDRPFSLFERLMTQPRILIHYLSQIFYPVPLRLSIEHDAVVSTSLLTPWTTLPTVLTILLLMIFSFYQMGQRPIISFSILFFFLNHLVESSILPLELIFEHRNYLPSLFVFFPVSIALKRLFDHYYGKDKPMMHIMMVSSVILLLIGLGIGTYIRNMAWATEKSLWEDAMAKAPKSDRPPHNLAWAHYSRIGDYQKALELYERSIRLNSIHSKISQNVSLTNMADIYYRKQEYETAIKLCRRALAINPKNETARYNMILQLLRVGKLKEASENADLLIKTRSNHPVYLDLKGLILLRQKKPDDALRYFKKALTVMFEHPKRLLYTGAALSLLGKYDAADRFLKRAHQLRPDDLSPLFHLIENKLRAGDVASADEYAERLMASGSVSQIQDVLTKACANDLLVPLSFEMVSPAIVRTLKKKADQLRTISAYSNPRTS